MATAISIFREPIRVIIGDNDPDIQLRENAQIDAAIRTIVDLAKVVGDQTTVAAYAVDTLRTSIEPTLTAVGDPKAFAQLVYYSAQLFITDMTPTSWRTRAFGETIGEAKEKVFQIMQDIYSLENGLGCASGDYPA